MSLELDENKNNNFIIEDLVEADGSKEVEEVGTVKTVATANSRQQENKKFQLRRTHDHLLASTIEKCR